MSLELFLKSQRPCACCRGVAELTVGDLTQEIGEGTTIEVSGLPVYRCSVCGAESVELESTVAIEDFMAQFVKELPSSTTHKFVITWVKMPIADNSNVEWDERFRAERPTLVAIG